MTTAAAFVQALRDALEPAANATNAADAAAYMRDQFAFLGVPTPERRRRQRSVFAMLAAPTERELRAVLRALWRQPEREFQHAGCDYLRAHVGVASRDFMATIHWVVTTRSWWDTVDVIAAHGAGALVRRHPVLVEVMDAWIADPNMWVARTAILHQLTYKDRTDADRLFGYCTLRASDTEFFIRKAIGWALRQYAAVDPHAVADFVATTPTLSGLAVREATKGVRRAIA